MAGSRTLKLSILAETKDLVKGLGDAEKATSSAGDKIKKGFKIAAAAVVAAGAAIGAFAVKSIAAGEAASTANARIEQINKSMGLFGGSVGEVNQRLIDYAEATARSTGVDTNSIKATQAKLLTFKELAKSADTLGGQFDRATAAAIDLAAAGFGSAETNAAQLGKALQDPIKGLTALARSGVTFTEVEKERIKTLVESNQVGEAQRLVLEAIEKQVGGTAEATANASDKIRVGFTQIQERVGIALLPVFEKLTQVLLEKVFPAFDQYVLPIFQKIGDYLNRDFAPVLQQKILPAFDMLWKLIQEYVYPTIKNLLTPVIEILGIGFQFLRDKIAENRDGINAMLGIMQNAWKFIRDYLAPIIGSVLSTAFNILFRAIGAIIDGMSKFFKAIQAVAKFLGYDLSLNLDFATKATNNLNTGTVEAYKSFAEQSKGIKNEVVPSLMNLSTATDTVTTAQNNKAAATTKATAAIKEQSKAATELAKLQKELADDPTGAKAVAAARAARTAAGIISPLGLGSGITDQNAYDIWQGLIDINSRGGLISGVNMNPNDPFFGFMGGGDPADLMRRRQAGQALPYEQNVTININGTVVDPEGAARAIEELITDSNSRGGTLGGVIFQ
jgi:hypothetical protein